MLRSKIASQNGIYTGFRAKEGNSALISSKETTILLEAKMRGSMLVVLIALCVGFCWGRSCYADIEKSDLDLENHDTTESEYSKKYATDDTDEYEKYVTKEYKESYEGKDRGSPEYKAKFSDGKRDSKEYQDMYANEEYKERRQLGYSKKYATNDTAEYEKYATEEYKDTYEGKDKGSPEYKAKFGDGKRDSKEYRDMYANEEYKEKRQIGYSKKYATNDTAEYEKYVPEEYKDTYEGKDKGSPEYKAKVSNGKRDSKEYRAMYANEEYKEKRQLEAMEYTSKDCNESVSDEECENVLKKYKFFKQLYEDDSMKMMLKPDVYADLEREMEEVGLPVKTDKTDSKKYSEGDNKYTSKDCDSSVSKAQCEKILKKYTFFKQLYADDDMMKMLKPDAYTDLQREMEEAGIPV